MVSWVGFLELVVAVVVVVVVVVVEVEEEVRIGGRRLVGSCRPGSSGPWALGHLGACRRG